MLHLSKTASAVSAPANPVEWERRALMVCVLLAERTLSTAGELRRAIPILEAGIAAARKLGRLQNAELLDTFRNDQVVRLAQIEHAQPRCPQCQSVLQFEPLRQITYCLCGFEQTAEERHGGAELARRQLDPHRPVRAFRRLRPGDLAR